MDTNSQQFQKAYSDLISAFINFMNVVNPGSANGSNAILHLIAAQLNQVLEMVKAQPINMQDTVKVDGFNNDDAPVYPQADTTVPQYQHATAPQPTVQQAPAQTAAQPTAPAPSPIGADAKVMYCQYPETFKGKLVFKSASLKESKEDTPLKVMGAAYLYKLTVDYRNGVGTIEIVPHNSSADLNVLELISRNPGSYMPALICQAPNGIPGKISKISSNSVLNLKLDGRSWVVADGEKFILDIE